MQLGFNENVMHNGKVYHIQTEDGGKRNPVITTLLFKDGGTIIGSKRTSYADIIKSDKLEMVVKEIMREQHAGMLKSLKKGDYDKPQQAAPAAAAMPARPPEPIIMPTEKPIEKTGAQFVEEKSLDDIILEYLSQSEKE